MNLRIVVCIVFVIAVLLPVVPTLATPERPIFHTSVGSSLWIIQQSAPDDRRNPEPTSLHTGVLDAQLGFQGATTVAVAPYTASAVIVAQAAQVVAGDHHTCALTRAGGVKCWGRNAYHQLDDGTWGFTSPIPVDVPGLSSGVAAIAATDDRTCAVMSTGEVKCWEYPFNATPSTLTNLTEGVDAIAMGAYHTCVLTEGGGVKCWTADSTTPVVVSGLTAGVISITAGEYHSCAMTIEGGVRCWGRNDSGQLGDGTTTSSTTPVNVSGLSTGATSISAGRSHTCAVAADGSVQCWGDNHTGQLGDGTHTNREIPVTVNGLTTGMYAVTAGDQHTCALTSGGGVKCWGANGYGQLGDGTTTSSTTPVNASDMATGVTAIIAGAYHTCAVIIGGGIKCWGNNDNGQLGNGSTNDHSIPGDVNGLTASTIASGDDHTCALTPGGGAKCWGRNDFGQVGDGTMNNRPLPVNVSGFTAGAHAISAGSSHTCTLLDGGGVKCWGHNNFGQLGNGTVDNSSIPVSVGGLFEGVTAIAAGQSHTCVLTLSGGVKCWGNNFFGQLGDGTTIGHLNPVAVSGLDTGVTAITAGASHTCALTATGGVKCWGLGFSGQLGDGNTLSHSNPVNVSGLGSGVTAITAGNNHTCALTTTGSIKCWGDNASGQLGDGTQNGHTIPVDVNDLAAVATAITAGAYHTCALTSDGGAKCWGANGAGRLGDGTTTTRTTPVDVRDLGAGVSAISAGDSHTCALIIAGSIKCWGASSYGQLGINLGWTPGDVIGFGPGVRTTYLPILLR